ncbi:Rab-GAP TBC domain-containing protein [Caenorhabditis elegans]|uniref:Rab-GAP TBC domain-containing protein n=1 Tax=Caenorhabditis elegans TaxID=6239 RepID=Q9U2D8_CAEEL|nr:Rab-GAP TBC domain-containing protein [Caenorhabditis elegans]CAB60374.4 Rab-GAP TBC domain-containing protein [Caenorhabditis elegans]|eukprot:NP_001022434.2 TBC (Tre-2/Bub2/Cdc16) domain family [Caenorhabditis elegans]
MNDQQQQQQQQQAQRERAGTVYYDAQQNFGTPPKSSDHQKNNMSSGGDYKDYNKMGIRKASGSSERGGITGGGGGGGPTDDILYERVHTERRHHHQTSSPSQYPRPPSRDRESQPPPTQPRHHHHQPTVIHHPIRSTGSPPVMMAPMSTSYDYSIGSSAGFRKQELDELHKSPGSRWAARGAQQQQEDFRPGPRASSAANIDALFAPKSGSRTQSASSSSGPSSRMAGGYEPSGGENMANVVFSRKSAAPRGASDKDFGVVGAYSSERRAEQQAGGAGGGYGRRGGNSSGAKPQVCQHSNDYELDPRLNVTYPQFYVDDWKDRHSPHHSHHPQHHQVVGNMTPTASSSGGYPRVPVPRHSPSFTSSATVYPLPGTGGRPRFGSDAHRHLYEEVPMGGGGGPSVTNGGYRSPGGPPYGSASTNMRETAILDDYDNVPSEFLAENVHRKHTTKDDVKEDGESGIYQPGRYQPSEDADSSSDEDDPEYLELMERDSIINRYEKGPDAADVDAWENPNFELYTNLDRFGFVHKKGEKATADERTDLQKRRIIKELSREKKWLKMIEVWKSGGPSKKMEDRIWKGIPEKLRIVIWPRLLGAERLKHERRDVYAELLLRARLVSKDIKQIDLDINRTYRDHLAFRKRYDVKQKSLLNVLAAYSMFNTEVGYCQGMSQIAALFLMYLDEEDAFWSLHQLMVSPKHTMHGFFVPGFPKLQRYEEHFKRVLKKYKPRVYKHLEKQDIPYIYLTKWWFGCFLDRVPFSLALRLWDVFLVEGDCILIAMAYNIMKMHEKNVRKHNMESFMEFIQNDIAIDFGYSDDEVMHSLRETLSKLKSDRQHVPPPPRPEDLSEVPTKALGPILQKPMASIRDEIHEIQSRRSRANSTGRSPYPKRKESARGAGAPKGPPPVQHKWNGNASQDSILGNGGGGGAGGREVPFEIPTRRAPNGSPAAAAPTDAYNNSKNGALPPSGSSKRDFVQSSNTPTTTTHSSSSHRYQHSNSSRGGTPLAQRLRDERSGQVVLLSRASDSEPDVGSPMTNTRDSDWNGSAAHISTATSRITHSGNHITRIDLDGDVSVI